MNDHGYTLAEMLAALLIIGLAMAGLTQAVRVLGLFQSSATRAAGEQRGLRLVEVDFARLLDGQGPFRSDETTLSGNGKRFDFDCGRPIRCSAQLVSDASDTKLILAGAADEQAPLNEDAHFTYTTDKATLTTWPPSAGELQTLRAINLVGLNAEPIVTARLWVQQSGDCAFDAIAQDCRKAVR